MPNVSLIFQSSDHCCLLQHTSPSRNRLRMRAAKPAPMSIHGWTVFAHPLFMAQVAALAQEVEALQQKDPAGYVKKNAAKRLAALAKLAFDVIPQDPSRAEYRQGTTLGAD
jgi:toxin YhaV